MGYTEPLTGLDKYMQPAQTTLEDIIKMFRQGGGYGAGQNAIIDTQANQAQAKAMSDQVTSGMSSGSLAASTGARISGDTAKAKLGVEDARTNFLAQAMQALSSLYGQFGQMGSTERMNQANIKAGQENALNDTLSRLVTSRKPDLGAGGGFNSPSGWAIQTPSEKYYASEYPVY